MKVVKKYHTQLFNSGKTAKINYLDAMKWLAVNVISVESIYDTLFNITKSDTGEITITLLAVFDDKDLWGQRCKSCKEFSKSFFITESTDCDRCKAKALRNDLQHRMTRITNAKKKKVK